MSTSPSPQVSVLVPVYNHGPFVAEALASILAQEVDFTFEILIGEDHSTDGSLAIVKDYQRRNPDVIRLVTDPSNVGMQANMARLIRASRAPLIAFCEGDDYWSEPTKLARQVAMLKSSPPTVAVHSDFSHLVHRAGEWRVLRQFWRSRGVDIPVGAVFDDLLVSNFIQTCTLMLRTDVAAAYLESDLPVATYSVGDWPLCLYASRQGAIAYLDEPLAVYRQVAGSATNQGAAADISRAKDSLRMAHDFVEPFGAGEELEARAHGRAYRHILGKALRSGDTLTATDALVWLTRHPGHVPPHIIASARVLCVSSPLARLYRWASRRRHRYNERTAYRRLN